MTAASGGATESTRRGPVEETGQTAAAVICAAEPARLTAAISHAAEPAELSAAISHKAEPVRVSTTIGPAAEAMRSPAATFHAAEPAQSLAATFYAVEHAHSAAAIAHAAEPGQSPQIQVAAALTPFLTMHGGATDRPRRLTPVREFMAVGGDWATFIRHFEVAFSSIAWTEAEALRALPMALDDDALAAFWVIPPEKWATLRQACGEMAAVFDPPSNARRKFLQRR
ncbi:unnamed protein product [Lampetra fluviatilis]